MGRTSTITEERIREMRELKSVGKKTREIAAITGVSLATVSRYTSQKLNGNSRRCPECGNMLLAKLQLNFCYRCGYDLRSPAVKLIPRVNGIIQNISAVYPANLRDEAIQTLNKVIDILKEA